MKKHMNNRDSSSASLTTEGERWVGSSIKMP